MATRAECEALRDAGTEAIFTARWSVFGRAFSEGCRGVVDQVGTPADPDVVIIRDASGKRHRWDMRHVSVS